MKLGRYVKNKTKQVEIYSWHLDGSFDMRDKKRLKPLTRLRSSMEEIELERKGSKRLRFKDWCEDIAKGIYK